MAKPTRRIGRSLALIAGTTTVLASAACSSDYATAPQRDVWVTVTPTWITGAGATGLGTAGVRFSVDAVIHNDGATEVEFYPSWCGQPIERRTHDGWVPAVSGGFCAYADIVAGAPTPIPPHSTLAQHLDVDARLPQGVTPDVPVWRSDSPTGVYRIDFQLTTSDHTPLPESERASPPFVIAD